MVNVTQTNRLEITVSTNIGFANFDLIPEVLTKMCQKSG